MKNMISLITILIVLLALTACKAVIDLEPVAQMADPNISEGAQSNPEKMAGELSAAVCPEAAPGTRQMIDAARGICFLYPDHFEAFEYGDGIGYTLMIPSLMENHESPVIWLTFEPANGRSLEEVTSQRLAEYAFPDTKSKAITLGDQPACMLDNLPGQDTNRRIVAVHDDRVIDILVDHIGKNYGAAGEQAESVHSMITGTFQITGIKPEAPLVTGPDCP